MIVCVDRHKSKFAAPWSNSQFGTHWDTNISTWVECGDAEIIADSFVCKRINCEYQKCDINTWAKLIEMADIHNIDMPDNISELLLKMFGQRA